MQGEAPRAGGESGAAQLRQGPGDSEDSSHETETGHTEGTRTVVIGTDGTRTSGVTEG